MNSSNRLVMVEQRVRDQDFWVDFLNGTIARNERRGRGSLEQSHELF